MAVPWIRSVGRNLTRQVIFPELDSHHMASRLDLDHLAGAVAPPHKIPTEFYLDINEQNSLAHLRGEVAGVNARVSQAITTLEIETDELRSRISCDFSGAGDIAGLAVDRVKAQSVDEIIEATRQREEIEADGRHYRHAHRGVRPSPQPNPRWKLPAAMAAAIGVEAACNFTTLAEGLRHGLLHGLLLGTALGAINVAAGFGAGCAVRQMFDPRRPRKLLGGLALGGYLVALAGWSLLLSYYREMLVQHPLDNPGVLAVQAFKEQGLAGAFHSVEGIILMGITAGFGVAAMCAAVINRDPHAVYTKIRAALAQARALCAQRRKEYLAAIDDGLTPVHSAIDQHRSDIVKARSDLRRNLAEAKAIIAGYRVFLDRVSHAAAQLCGHYRAAVAALCGIDVSVYKGEFDLGAALDLVPVAKRIAALEEELNDPRTNAALDRAAAEAHAEVRAVARATIGDSQTFFKDCEARVMDLVNNDGKRSPPEDEPRPIPHLVA
jgi:hypothetical protein